MSDFLKTMGKRCFYNCQKLKSMMLPFSLKTIPQYAFYKCTSLKSMIIKKHETKTYEHSCFHQCPFPKDKYNIPFYSFVDCDENQIEMINQMKSYQNRPTITFSNSKFYNDDSDSDSDDHDYYCECYDDYDYYEEYDDYDVCWSGPYD